MVPAVAHASPSPRSSLAGAMTSKGDIKMNKVQTVAPADNFTKLKELFGPPPVLSSEDHKAYDAMWTRILESFEARDFIEGMLGKDLTDATWEMKRYSRHKALVIERRFRAQAEHEEKTKQ